MPRSHNAKLLRLIKIIPPIIVTAFACLVIAIVVRHNNNQLTTDIESLQQDFIASEKESIKAQVTQLIQQIIYEKNSTESILKSDIKERIYQAHAIASNIYHQNANKSEQEVTKLISDALRHIRFNNGRGYYFIYKIDGSSVMHPVVPTMEGSSKIDLQDVRGNFIVRDMGQLAKNNGEGFYHWWFVKPEQTDKQFEKIGFGKYFAPYDWFIGTGEYLIDVENDIKQRLLQRISKIRYGDNGFIFVIDFAGNMLSHFRSELENTNIFSSKDELVVSNGRRIIDTAKQGDGYLQYLSSVMPSSGQPAEKISYVAGVPDWNWAVGSGTYITEIERYLEQRKKIIAEQNQAQLLNILWLSLFVTAFFVGLSLFVAKYLTQRFTAYEQKIGEDFAELNKIKEQSEYQALHDSLTQLPNRVLLEQQIASAIELSEKSHNKLALMFVDLDDFKKINDLHGHSVGDGLLKLLGVRFNKILQDDDTVARFGGDEFIFCFPNLANAEAAEDKVNLVRAIFNQVFTVKGKEIYSSCSIGVAMYPNDGVSAEELISKADIVLYKSKAEQKGRFLFFDESINKQVKRDFLVESELRWALEENELSVKYQPQICINSGDIFGVEALIRWQSKVLGPVSPIEFIHIAESIGLINKIGLFVIEQSMKDIKKISSTLNKPLHLSINISPKQLIEPNFEASVVDAAKLHTINTNCITLEITENVLINDLAKVQPILQNLRNHGFNISLDDFGTGYSSLSYLSNLPINEIKIDRSFIDKFLTNHQSESLVKTIIAIGQFCNLTVVAEGVETKEQYERLVKYNCNLIQGYYFAAPLSLEELTTKYCSSL